MSKNCDRCGDTVESTPTDGMPVVCGSNTHIEQKPQSSKDPAFVGEWETAVYEEPQIEMACNDCQTESDTPIDEVPTEDLGGRRMR